jgi:hypothetical protein
MQAAASKECQFGVIAFTEYYEPSRRKLGKQKEIRPYP